ncbi:hypothetical protein V6N13_019992 [Hibiscus sabdariffa]|uniref:Uncharacterized protein n=1 Tax=Hibiscus sabdariffa TaxID=183260 RepID=A0ABR2ES70_9ROSI
MFSVQSVNHNVETDMDLFDDILKLVKGNSVKVVQVYANLLSYYIKFTTLRHIIVHEWRENPNVSSEYGKFSLNQKKPLFTAKTKLKHHGNHTKVVKKAGDSKIWMHGDTSLGLCASSEPSSTRWEEKSGRRNQGGKKE